MLAEFSEWRFPLQVGYVIAFPSPREVDTDIALGAVAPDARWRDRELITGLGKQAPGRSERVFHATGK